MRPCSIIIKKSWPTNWRGKDTLPKARSSKFSHSHVQDSVAHVSYRGLAEAIGRARDEVTRWAGKSEVLTAEIDDMVGYEWDKNGRLD